MYVYIYIYVVVIYECIDKRDSRFFFGYLKFVCEQPIFSYWNGIVVIVKKSS